jgi:hypothetical protein
VKDAKLLTFGGDPPPGPPGWGEFKGAWPEKNQFNNNGAISDGAE